jgi:hypothetical protein
MGVKRWLPQGVLQCNLEAAIMKPQPTVDQFLGTIVSRGLRKSQADALAFFVASALRLARAILTDLPVKPGCRHFWRQARCGKKPVIVRNIMVYYEKNLPEKRDEPWFLATSLTATARQLVRLFARRMGIEE